MKKLMLALAACAAFVSVASADDTAWFNGNIGGTAEGGAWGELPDGATLESNKYVLDGVESELAFTATTKQALSGSADLIFTSTAKFDTAYDEFPEIPSGAKGGIIAFDDGDGAKYYVLTKDSTAATPTNKWTATSTTATLDTAVTVTITISYNSGAYATYKVGDTAIAENVAIVVDDTTWGTVSYLGSGEVASLVGTTHQNTVLLTFNNTSNIGGIQVVVGTTTNDVSGTTYAVNPNSAFSVIYTAANGYLFPNGKNKTESEYASGVATATTIDVSEKQVAAAKAKVGDADYYLTLAAAVSAANAGNTVSLLANETLESTLTIDKAITVDLGNFEVSLAATGHGLVVTTNATIQNGTLTSTRTTQSPDNYANGIIAIKNIATSAVYSNLTVNAKNYRQGIYCDYGDVDNEYVTIYNNEPTWEVKCYNVDIIGGGSQFLAEWTKLTLDADCSATPGTDAFSYQAAIYSASHAIITVQGGAYTNALSLLSGNLGGAIIVNGGTFKGDIKSWMQAGLSGRSAYENLDSYKADFQLNAGTFDGSIVFQDTSAAARAYDTFYKDADNVTLAAPSGYLWNGSGILIKGLSGSGTADDPWQLASTNDLQIWKDNADIYLASKCYKVTADITITADAAATLLPLYPTSGAKFAGTFDGDNHKITYTFDATSTVGALFGYAQGATFKNLWVDGTVTMTSYKENAAVLLANGYGKMLFDNVTTDGSLSGAKMKNGAGVCMYYSSAKGADDGLTFNNCTNKADITSAYTKFGGMIAYTGADGSYNVAIIGCSNEGDITCTGSTGGAWVGGMAGWVGYGSNWGITNCCNSGALTAVESVCQSGNSSVRVGGMIACVSKPFVLNGCSNSGTITGTGNSISGTPATGGIGGLVGETDWNSPTIIDCSNTGTLQYGSGEGTVDISSFTKIGSLVGYTVNNVTREGTVTAQDSILPIGGALYSSTLNPDFAFATVEGGVATFCDAETNKSFKVMLGGATFELADPNAWIDLDETLTNATVTVASALTTDYELKHEGVRYSLEAKGWDAPGGIKIVVDEAWATANGIDAEAFASADKLSNGFSASESYVLGLNTNESLTISTGYKSEYITVKVDQNANVADKVTYDIWIDGVVSIEGATTFPTNCFARNAAGTDERTIEIRPSVTGQSTTGTSQTIGIWASNAIGTNSTGYVTIPYECAVSEAMYTLFNDGDDWDFMYVLDPTSGEWDTWKIKSSGNTWTYVPTASRETPITTVLRPGQAVKVSVGAHKYGDDKRFWRCGNKVDRTKTTLVAGYYNLVGNPEGTAFSTSKLDNSAKIKLKSGTDILPNTSYFKYGQKWYRQPLNGTAVEKTEVEAADVNGFFLNSPATSIQW